MPRFYNKPHGTGTETAPPNICTELIEFIKEIINSDQFIKQYRQKPTDFIRQKTYFFNSDIFLINLVKGSYQEELDHFFKAIFRTNACRYML